jgi:hypothetical protein
VGRRIKHMNTTITRNDYISGKVTHDEYYAQFVTPSIYKLVEYHFGRKVLEDAYKKDESLNTIPLHRWDNLAGDIVGFDNLSMKVCTLKRAAKMIVNNEVTP